MDAAAPPICARIRETRERLRDEAKAQGGPEAAKEFSQEQVAHRVGVSLKAYRAYEDFREPDYERRKAIAKALGFSEDYFEIHQPEDARFRQIVQEELEGVRDAVERIEDLLSQREEQSPARPERA
jgi:transcriptional regulator with XRE-family HTH domain